MSKQKNYFSFNIKNSEFQFLGKNNLQTTANEENSYISALKKMRDDSIKREIRFYQMIGFTNFSNLENMNFQNYKNWLFENAGLTYDLLFIYLYNKEMGISGNYKIVQILKCFMDQRFYDGLYFPGIGSSFETIKDTQIIGELTLRDLQTGLTNLSKGRNRFSSADGNKAASYMYGRLKKYYKHVADLKSDIVSLITEIDERYKKGEKLSEEESITYAVFTDRTVRTDGRYRKKYELNIGKIQDAAKAFIPYYVSQSNKIGNKLKDKGTCRYDIKIDDNNIIKFSTFFSSIEKYFKGIFGSSDFYNWLESEIQDEIFQKNPDLNSIKMDLRVSSKGQEEEIYRLEKVILRDEQGKEINHTYERGNKFITDRTGNLNLLYEYLKTTRDLKNKEYSKKDYDELKEKFVTEVVNKLIEIISYRVVQYKKEGSSFNIDRQEINTYINKIKEATKLSEKQEKDSNKQSEVQETMKILKSIEKELKATLSEYCDDFLLDKEKKDKDKVYLKDDVNFNRIIISLFRGRKDYLIKGNLAELLVTSFLKKYPDIKTKLTGKEDNSMTQSMHADIVQEINGVKIGFQSKVKMSDDFFDFYGSEKIYNTFGKGIPRYIIEDEDLATLRYAVFFQDSYDSTFLTDFLNQYLKYFLRFEDYTLKGRIYEGTQNNFFVVNYQLIPTSLILDLMIKKAKEEKIINWNFKKFYKKVDLITIQIPENSGFNDEGNDLQKLQNLLAIRNQVNIKGKNEGDAKEKDIESSFYETQGINFSLKKINDEINTLISEFMQKRRESFNYLSDFLR